MSSPILYYLPPSPPCRAVLMFAQIIGLMFDLKIVDLSVGAQLKPDFIKINPQHTIPTLDDNGFILWESRAIMTYLSDAYAKNDSMYPKDIQTRALIDQRLQFDLGTLYQRHADYYFPTMHRAEPQVQTNLPKLQEALGFLEAMLVDRQWVASDHFTVADLSLTVTVSQIDGFGFDMTAYPRIVEWFGRCKEVLGQYGYQDINQKGLDILVGLYKSNLKQ